MSVGTARQWLGRLGKVDKGQVAVFGALARGRFGIPVDARLYLPKVWTDDPERCEKAGIPETEREFKTKEKLALEIVENALQNGLRFGWVGADGGYGKGPEFCRSLDDMEQKFVVDVHADFRVYLEDPKPYVPVKTKKRGPQFKRYRSDVKSLEARQVVGECSLSSQPVLNLRKTSREESKTDNFGALSNSFQDL